MQALVPGDELVGEGETGHQAALLEPEDGAERAGEEDALDGGIGDEPLRIGPVGVDPLDRPVRCRESKEERLDASCTGLVGTPSCTVDVVQVGCLVQSKIDGCGRHTPTPVRAVEACALPLSLMDSWVSTARKSDAFLTGSLT